jgi:transposase
MAKKKRYSRVEIASKLAQANDLATQGKLQSEVARTLGVSVMTLHRWRKASATHEPGQPYRMRRGGDRIAELQLENSRLRRLVTDLLLEKIKLEEAGGTFGQVNDSKNASRGSKNAKPRRSKTGRGRQTRRRRPFCLVHTGRRIPDWSVEAGRRALA